MKKKNMTTDQLAVMINKGFNGIHEEVDKRFTRVDTRLMHLEIRMDHVEREIETIRKHQIAHTIYRDEFEKLDSRVKALEKLLIKHT